jgi:hypothetical protein
MAESVRWRGDWDEALKEAEQANLPLLLEFHLEG